MKLPSHAPATESISIILAGVALATALLVCPGGTLAAVPEETVIYSFQRNNGYWVPGPNGGLVADPGGSLYGVTCCDGPYNWGTVFELSPPSRQGDPWTEATLLNFDFNNGAVPYGALVLDQAGNLYGTTQLAGGNVYELSPPAQGGGEWTQTVLFTFSFANVYSPEAGVVFDQDGNIYGTASEGGRGCSWNGGCGGVYQLVKPKGRCCWTERALYQFGGCGNCGTGGFGNLAIDTAGALYGTTVAIGKSFGSVYKLTPPQGKSKKWIHSVLYQFQGGSDGANPYTGVIFGAQGDLYGTTRGGGAYCGTIFELTPTPAGSWTKSVIYSFQGGADGCGPTTSLTFDGSGNLYGTMSNGGNGSCGCGYVFELSPPVNGGPWTKTLLYAFEGGSDAAYPNGGVIFGLGGALYGEADGGTGNCSIGSGCGAVYSIAP